MVVQGHIGVGDESTQNVIRRYILS